MSQTNPNLNKEDNINNFQDGRELTKDELKTVRALAWIELIKAIGLALVGLGVVLLT